MDLAAVPGNSTERKYDKIELTCSLMKRGILVLIVKREVYIYERCSRCLFVDRAGISGDC